MSDTNAPPSFTLRRLSASWMVAAEIGIGTRNRSIVPLFGFRITELTGI